MGCSDKYPCAVGLCEEGIKGKIIVIPFQSDVIIAVVANIVLPDEERDRADVAAVILLPAMEITDHAASLFVQESHMRTSHHFNSLSQ